MSHPSGGRLAELTRTAVVRVAALTGRVDARADRLAALASLLYRAGGCVPDARLGPTVGRSRRHGRRARRGVRPHRGTRDSRTALAQSGPRPTPTPPPSSTRSTSAPSCDDLATDPRRHPHRMRRSSACRPGRSGPTSPGCTAPTRSCSTSRRRSGPTASPRPSPWRSAAVRRTGGSVHGTGRPHRPRVAGSRRRRHELARRGMPSGGRVALRRSSDPRARGPRRRRRRRGARARWRPAGSTSTRGTRTEVERSNRLDAVDAAVATPSRAGQGRGAEPDLPARRPDSGHTAPRTPPTATHAEPR